MGQLYKGKWVTENIHYSEQNDFTKQLNTPEYPVQAGRYHLYISYACPFAHRALLVWAIKGLHRVVTTSGTKCIRKENGWELEDSYMGKKYLHEIYTTAKPDYTGRATIPVLFDKATNTIVNNQSSEIMKMFNEQLHEFSDYKIDLYTLTLQQKIDEAIDFIHNTVFVNIHKVRCCDTQEEYDQAVTAVFEGLNILEEQLSKQRYLLDKHFTLADICLFSFLIRFDAVFFTRFKCNIRRLIDYRNLFAYTREIYQMPNVAATVNIPYMKRYAYLNNKESEIVPKGPEVDFTLPHGRDKSF